MSVQPISIDTLITDKVDSTNVIQYAESAKLLSTNDAEFLQRTLSRSSLVLFPYDRQETLLLFTLLSPPDTRFICEDVLTVNHINELWGKEVAYLRPEENSASVVENDNEIFIMSYLSNDSVEFAHTHLLLGRRVIVPMFDPSVRVQEEVFVNLTKGLTLPRINLSIFKRVLKETDIYLLSETSVKSVNVRLSSRDSQYTFKFSKSN